MFKKKHTVPTIFLKKPRTARRRDAPNATFPDLHHGAKAGSQLKSGPSFGSIGTTGGMGTLWI